jgi:ring-1,2-phenylacetyl-CoA epoxidase subunit PaaD
MTSTPNVRPHEEAITIDMIWEALDEVTDPEIPVVSLVDLGVVRDVSHERGGRVQVTITPTFTGCPAQMVMQQDIRNRLAALGVSEVEVLVTLSPPWSSNWITEKGRRQLREFGLSPPPRHEGDFESVIALGAICPYCDSENTSLRNSFGPTLCRAIYYCNACDQPFEQFKPL